MTHFGRPGTIATVRCACQRCGAHVQARVGYTVGGSCSVCGGYDLRPVASGRIPSERGSRAQRLTGSRSH